MAFLRDAFIVGVVANLVIDVFEYVLERYLGKARDWHLVGRWVAHMPTGSFVLDATDDSKTVKGELLIGWAFHYAVGIFYAALYLILVEQVFEGSSSLLMAISFGVMTVAAPWFILMPGLGVGAFASNASRPAFVRITSLTVHGVFGLGLYVGLMVAGQI